MKAIVDTTVLTDALIKPGGQGDVARASLQRYKPTLLPTYAIKEFKAGPLHYYVWFHNKVVEASTYGEVIAAISANIGWRRHLPATAMKALADFSSSIAKQTPPEISRMYPDLTVDGAQLLQLRRWLKQRILRTWRNRRNLVSEVISPLSCYVEKAPELRHSGQLDDAPLKCGVVDCCLRQRYKDRLGDLELLEKASVGTKVETVKRRAALNRLRRHPKSDYEEKHCRALGDAVFSLDCPDDAVILTTNIVDHEPLARALGRCVEAP
ncbi:hypothetical protein [Methyloceanibacter sp.]|uniref:hypothetical protein n=1 Tax=Methyloceanibacter sp. TaxID=1965321 RepID=UPI003D6D89CA